MNILEEVKNLPKKNNLSDHRESISLMRDKGYTWREIAKFFNERGVKTDHTKIYKLMKRGGKMEQSEAYEKIRRIVKNNGGEMTWKSKGVNGVIWSITLNEGCESYASNGEGHIPELDSLYIPRKVNPTSWNDYKDELLEDAEEVFLARFGL